MPRRILIVPDKFKGTLTAHEAASAIAAGWSAARPDDILDLLPMTDGGDGFGAVLGELTGARPMQTQARDAAHQPWRAQWWLDRSDKIAIIDSAGIIGLAMLPIGGFHPFQLDSFGLGQVMNAAAHSTAQTGLIGIGGSATNDGGFGMARALGWKFFTARRRQIKEWWQLAELADIRPPSPRFPLKVTVAVDVSNPLLGPQGCSRIYGPQKGLTPQDFAHAEKCLSRLDVILQTKFAKTPGAGAAGGLGFGLMAFAQAKLESGFGIFARYSHLDDRIHQADLVITGEGRLDEQTYMGKGVGQIAQRCGKMGIPCFAMGGTILEPARARTLFTQARALTEITDPASARSAAALHLCKLARQMSAVSAK